VWCPDFTNLNTVNCWEFFCHCEEHRVADPSDEAIPVVQGTKEPGEIDSRANKMTVINWEFRNRRPKGKFHGSLKRVLDIEIEPETSE
jgi:hypothetical protein